MVVVVAMDTIFPIEGVPMNAMRVAVDLVSPLRSQPDANWSLLEGLFGP